MTNPINLGMVRVFTKGAEVRGCPITRQAAAKIIEENAARKFPIPQLVLPEGTKMSEADRLFQVLG